MSEIRHRKIQTNGIQMHIAEAGAGPVVLLCHGFPELWYSWRHQLPALAAAGFHVVAPDMRGYGQTDAPPAIESYTILHLVGDMIGLLDALGAKNAVIAGHDWGSIVAWTAALLRPDRFRGVVGMSVPFVPRAPMPPTQLMKMMAGERFLYILYFQEPGKAEAELEADPERSMRMILYSGSGSVPEDHVWNFELPKSAGFLSGMSDPAQLPSWLGKNDLAVYADEFARTGFRGGLNWYRNFDRNWELTAAWQDAKITIPCAFIGGLKDMVVTGPRSTEEGPMVRALPSFVTDLRVKALIPGAGHWNQQEKPGETNAALLEFLRQL